MTQTQNSNPNSIRHEWFQSDQFVMLNVFARNCEEEFVQIDYGNGNHLSLNVNLDGDSTRIYSLELDLAGTIDPQHCRVSYLPSKIELKLKKSVEGIKWNTLEKVESEEAPAVAMNAQTIGEKSEEKPPTYPSSSKKRIDWSKLEQEVEKSESTEQNPEGDDALNQLFQKIYKDGNDEVRKAMMKSFSESGGTCLSTNWDEVKKDRVPIRPPDGMEAKKW